MLKETIKESLQKNKNLSQLDRDIIPRIISDYCNFFSMHGIEFDSVNTEKLLETLSLKKKEKNEKKLYDIDSNSILFPNELDTTEDELFEMYEKAILSLMTTTYDFDANEYSEGLNFSVENKKYGSIVNEKVRDRIHELIYGNIDKEIVIVPTVLDRVASDFEKIVGVSDLLTYYLNSKGNLFYNKMCEITGSEKEVIDLFEILNKYETVDKNNMYEMNKLDIEYSSHIEHILENKKVETLGL